MGGLIFNGLFAALMIFLYNYVGKLSYTQVGTETIGPAGFPQLLIVLILIGLAIVSVRDIIKLRKENANPDKQEKPKIAREDIIRLVLFCVAMILYAVLLPYVGFIICTVCLIFAMIEIIGYPRLVIALVAAVGITLLITFVFGELFNVALPRGVGFFRILSQYIY